MAKVFHSVHANVDRLGLVLVITLSISFSSSCKKKLEPAQEETEATEELETETPTVQNPRPNSGKSGTTSTAPKTPSGGTTLPTSYPSVPAIPQTEKLTLQAKQIVAGAEHTCVILMNNTMKCWGYGYYGQLGQENQSNIIAPVLSSVNVGLGRTVNAMAAGNSHTCALLDNNTVKCWGKNSEGQLGNGSTSNLVQPATLPIQLGSDKTALAVAAGYEHSCALLNDHSVKCWGSNTHGQLGNGNTTHLHIPPDNPIDLGSGMSALAITAGERHSCAILNDQSVKCWGAGGAGQLGHGGTGDLSAPAAQSIDLGAGKTATAISAGSFHTCALLNDGALKCWGLNYSGQLGYGSGVFSNLNSPSINPIDLGAGKTALAVAAGPYHTCALLNDGTVKCWGMGAYGQLGYGTLSWLSTPAANPINLGNGQTALAIAVGGSHSCAILQNNSVTCWGRALFGQLGHENAGVLMAPDADPIDLKTGLAPVSVDSGPYHTCAILSDGSVKCWGMGSIDQLGYGDGLSLSSPAAQAINLGGGRTALALALGGFHTCALLNDATVSCWGDGSNGQLGDGSFYNRRTTPPLTPVNLGVGKTATSIASGFSHNCALLNDQSIKCWGQGSSGQLGTGSTVDLSAPPANAIDLGQGRTALAVAAGYDHTCAILDDSSVKCWGSSSVGQLGYGNTTSEVLDPASVGSVDLGAGRTALAISLGARHTCALLDNSTVKCWGDSGGTGYGAMSNIYSPPANPIYLGAGKTALAITAGSNHSCAILNDSSVKCWGYNFQGQLGYGNRIFLSSPSSSSIQLGTAKSAQAISAGMDHTCALLNDNTLKCWGSASYGQIGYPQYTSWKPWLEPILDTVLKL